MPLAFKEQFHPFSRLACAPLDSQRLQVLNKFFHLDKGYPVTVWFFHEGENSKYERQNLYEYDPSTIFPTGSAHKVSVFH